MFRYRMIRDDRLLLGRRRHPLPDKTLRSPAKAYVFCRQADAVATLLVNNAVLRLPPSEPALAELVATARGAVDADQRWGALGPFLLTPVLTRHGLYDRALDPHVCYPIEPEQFWKLFLPTYRDCVAEKARDATHAASLERGDRWSGYDFWVCPPDGSYLHEAFPSGRRSRPVPPRQRRRRSAPPYGPADRGERGRRKTPISRRAVGGHSPRFARDADVGSVLESCSKSGRTDLFRRPRTFVSGEAFAEGLGAKNCRFVTPKLPPISGLERCQQAGSSSE